MNSKEIFRALQAGEIQPVDAEREIAEIMRSIKIQSQCLSCGELPEINGNSILSNCGNEDNLTNQSDEFIRQPLVELKGVEPCIAKITMQDRVHKNAFSAELIMGLTEAFQMVEASQNYKVVILTGYDSYFSLGGTREELMAINEGKLKFTDMNVFSLALNCKIPVIAAIQGHCLGAGWCLGMFSDFIVMSSESIYSASFMKLGFTPGAGATLIFPMKLGINIAQEILFSGKTYRGRELKSKGISIPVFPRKEVLPYALMLARKICNSTRDSLIILKEHMTKSIKEQLSNTIEKEMKMHEKTFINNPEVRNRIINIFDTPKKATNVEDFFNHIRVDSLNPKSKNENGLFDSVKPYEKPVHRSINGGLKKDSESDIAIIGLSGCYPEAKNISELWHNLRNGKDCIVEIPRERWDYTLYYDKDKSKMGKSYCKWGGFIDGVEKFDPLFFNISPKEAKIMNPMERLFLETVWSLFESAGYTRETLQKVYQGRVGVYVGAMYHQYNLFKSDIVKESIIALSSYYSIANRISYFFNLHGPSMAIDTACSSSAIAIHMACESLRRDECPLVVAGGVNLSIHPKKFLGLSLSRMVGSSIESRSFGKGDGFLPAEGVGAVLLKPLSIAIKDHDNILAIIKSTATNHGGKSNGFTAPNQKAQEQLIEKNFKKSGINPRTISYVEAAANGSDLGDVTEIIALKKVFEKHTSDKNFCGIGSVKSNIGHAEAASGISQLTKVVLQMQHKQLVPTIKAEPLNPRINFNNTPFSLQRELQKWKRPVIIVDGELQEFPRRATISSFGGGGSNAHLIVEEYVPAKEENNDQSTCAQIAIFSAKNAVQLKILIKNFLHFIDSEKELSLLNAIYTLQIGREEMANRLAIIVNTLTELVQGLKVYLKLVSEEKDVVSSIPIFTGIVQNDNGTSNLIDEKDEDYWLQQDLTNLAEIWIQGGKIPWEIFYKGKQTRRMFLPTYPFERRRCWIDELSHSITAPVTDLLKEQIINIVSRLLEMASEEIDINTPISKYGFDSILLLQLLQQLQNNVNPLVDFEKLRKCTTIQDIVSVTQEQYGDDVQHQSIICGPTVWPQFPELIRLNHATKERPVFWFHGGAAGVEGYQTIAQVCKRPFYGIQPRGWMTNRSPLRGIQAMASYYTHIIQSVQPEGPYDLGGFSLGGAIAYEVTRQLQELGQVTDTIVMLDSLDAISLRKIRVSKRDFILRAVNMLIYASKSNNENLEYALINRDELDLTLNEEDFLEELIAIAKKRGLTKTKNQICAQVNKNVEVQEAYELNNCSILPLSHPESISCYYLRNKGGLFFGQSEPYFAFEFDKSLDFTDYWREWENQFVNFNIIDVDSSNHMMLLYEPNPLKTIINLSERLYS